MVEKLKRNFNLLFGTMSLLIGIIYCIENKSMGLGIFCVSFCAFLVVAVINQLVIKDRLPFYMKNDIGFLTIYLFSLVVLSAILKSNIALTLELFISNILFYIFLSNEFFEEKHISLIIFGLISLLIANITFNLYMCLMLLAFLLLVIFDETSPHRKINYVIIMGLEIVLGIVFLTNYHFISFIMLFFLFARKKIGSLRLLVEMSIIPIVLTIVLFFTTNFSNMLCWNLIIDNYDSIFFLIISLTVILCFINTLIENNSNTVLKMALLILMLGMIVFLNETIYLVSALIPLIILLGDTMNKMPRLVFKKTHIFNKHSEFDPPLKISAVIPNYNYENYIEERIDSVLFQSYPVSELIVLDDVSKDNSVEVIEKKLAQVKRDYPNLKIKFIPNKVNSGNVFKQWRKCFEEASGDYLWICEADDSASPYFLKNIMKFFEKDKDIVIAHSESLTMDGNNNILMQNLREWVDIFKTDKWCKDFIDDGEYFNKNYLVVNNTIANVSGAVFKKRKDIPFEKFLKEAEAYKLAGDWYFYEKVLNYGKIAYSHKSLNYHRMHSSSVTLTTKREKEYEEICCVQDDIMKHFKLATKVLDRIEERRIKFKTNYGFSDEEIELNNISWDKMKKKMSDKTMLSIIIPVYNTEPYLEKCLNSVLENLPPKTELVIVNDGSPDNSENIIKGFVDKYPNIIKYFKKKNGGLSSAKNFGIEKANGKYIGFLDSDDYVKNNMFDCMLKKAIMDDADIVYCDVELVYEDGSSRFMSSSNVDVTDSLMQCLDNPLMPASWSKIVKKNLFKGLDYPVGYNNEDIAVSPILFARSMNTKTVPSAFYKYYQRSGSIQNSGFSEKRFVAFKTAHICFERAKEFDEDVQLKIKGVIYSHQLFSLLLLLIMKEKNYQTRLEFIRKFKKEINTFDDYQDNPYLIEYIKGYNREKLIYMLKHSSEKRIDLYLKTGI